MLAPHKWYIVQSELSFAFIGACFIYKYSLYIYIYPIVSRLFNCIKAETNIPKSINWLCRGKNGDYQTLSKSACRADNLDEVWYIYWLINYVTQSSRIPCVIKLKYKLIYMMGEDVVLATSLHIAYIANKCKMLISKTFCAFRIRFLFINICFFF